MTKLSRLSILTCALSYFTAHIFAAEENTYQNIEVNSIIVKNAHLKEKCQTVNPVQPCCVTPSAMIILGLEAEPFFTTDYLCWSVRQENMEYAYQVLKVGINDSPISTRLQSPHWKYNSGFRVGAGLDFKRDGWDVYLNYTWFHPSKFKRHSDINTPNSNAVNSNFLEETWQAGAAFSSAASEDWSFKDDEVNWELGRNFFISRFLTVRPFTGFKTAWQEQKQHLVYDNIISPTGIITLSNHLDFWGMGIRLGINSAWYIYKKYLSIVGDIAFSGLWSCVKLSQMVIDPENKKLINVRVSYHTIRPILEWALGFQWDCWIYQNRMKLSLRAAWEEQVWINQNSLISPITASLKAKGGDLSLQGLTARARFDF